MLSMCVCVIFVNAQQKQDPAFWKDTYPAINNGFRVHYLPLLHIRLYCLYILHASALPLLKSQKQDKAMLNEKQSLPPGA